MITPQVLLHRRKREAYWNANDWSNKWSSLCREEIDLNEVHGNWKYKRLTERRSCAYLSSGCPFFSCHNEWRKEAKLRYGRSSLPRIYDAVCINCKKPRRFYLVSLDKPSRAKCNHCTPPVPKVKKRRKPLFRNPVIPGPTKVTKKGWCVCPTNSSVAQKCFCFGTLREIKQ